MGNGGWSGRAGSMLRMTRAEFSPPERSPKHSTTRLATRPPTRDGVSPSVMVLPSFPADQQPASLLSFLERSAKIPCAQTWFFRLENGLVWSEQGTPLDVHCAYRAGERIWYWRHVEDEPRVPFEEQIIYQDDHLLVADKPHFLPVTPTGRYVQETLLVRLKKRTGLHDLAPIHRIDRDTAGLVMFSVRPSERGAYMSLFRQRQVAKTYECIAPRISALAQPGDTLMRQSRLEDSPQSFMQMIETEGEPNSETRITLLECLPNQHARYQLEPLTGKRHQLRVHMMQLGAPIAGDGIYPVLTPEPAPEAVDYQLPMQLLARELRFGDPVTGQMHHFVSRRTLHHAAQ
jgi:tRNA pseudouridine32 synthase / 23S rRNA pseudouridine746 synthase